jgi:hypothetical protein
VVSILRTVVPVLWGTLITYLVSLVPGVAVALAPAQPIIAGWGVAIAAAITAGWYALMRKIEPKLPGWLTVIVLGSNQTPKYVDPARTQAALDRYNSGLMTPQATANTLRPNPDPGGTVDPAADGRAN